VITQSMQDLHFVNLQTQGEIFLKYANRQELQVISANYGHLTYLR